MSDHPSVMAKINAVDLMAKPAALMTNTTFVIIDFTRFLGDGPGWGSLMEWCRVHGIDPNEVAVSGPIIRVPSECRVVYCGINRPAQKGGFMDWEIRSQQGETPPMPWPEELERYRV